MKSSGLIRTSIAASLLLSVAFVADAKIARTGTPSVLFRASGPAGMKIQGSTSDLDVDDQGAKIVVRVPLKNLSTGIALRDDHMRNKYLEVGTYPNAELTVDRSAIRLPSGADPISGDATGTVGLHGKTKSTSFHYNVGKIDGNLRVSGTIHLDMRDYGITVPTYLGVTVKPEVDVEVQFSATP